MCTKTRRGTGGRHVGIKRQPVHCASGGGEGIGKTRRTAREQTQPPGRARRPSRVSTSCQRVCLSSPFVLSHSNKRSNQTTRAPMSSPSLGACKQNHPLEGESISPRAKMREWEDRGRRFVSTGDWTWRSSSIINIWVMLQRRIDGTQEWWRVARKMVIDLTNFARSVDACRCFAEDNIWINFLFFGYNAESCHWLGPRKLIMPVWDKVTTIVAINQELFSEQFLRLSLIELHFMMVQYSKIARNYQESGIIPS